MAVTEVTFTKSVSKCVTRETPSEEDVCNNSTNNRYPGQGTLIWNFFFVFVQIKEKKQNKTTLFGGEGTGGGKDEEQSVFPRISVT